MNPASGNAQLLIIVLGVIGAPLTTFLGYCVHRLIAVYEAKTGLTVSASQEATLDGWVEEAVTLAEHRGAQALLNSGQALSGPAKLNVATTYVADNIKRLGLDTVAQAHLESMVDALVAQKKAAGKMPAFPAKAQVTA